MPRLEHAVDDLERALASLPRQGGWGARIRRLTSDLASALAAEHATVGDPWLSARTGHLERERRTLLARLAAATGPDLESGDPEVVRTELLRLAHDVSHHLQRVHDLYYDAVALDVGGSE